MAKHRKKKGTTGEDIPVASFSDVAFLLIIFFLLATTLQQISGFTTELPAGEKAEQQAEEMPTVTLKGGKIFLNENKQPLDDMKELREKLKELKLPAKKNKDDRIVTLEAVGRVEYQQYFEAMSIITAAGGYIGIVREDEKGG
jgi:biopolymer transport protein ExbD